MRPNIYIIPPNPFQNLVLYAVVSFCFRLEFIYKPTQSQMLHEKLDDASIMHQVFVSVIMRRCSTDCVGYM
jgi:hypothetical protein